jgi:prevent-host-death family protein
MKTTDVALGAFEAKNKFSELLERVGRGAEFTITKHDRPVARLVPAFPKAKDQRKKTTAELRVLRARYSLKGLSGRTLIEAGRR